MTLEPTDSDWFANGIYVREGLNVKYNIVSGVFLTKSWVYVDIILQSGVDNKICIDHVIIS